jgi:hypothetical protein
MPGIDVHSKRSTSKATATLSVKAPKANWRKKIAWTYRMRQKLFYLNISRFS